MIISITIIDIADCDDYSESELANINPEYASKIPVALDAWKSYYNYKRGFLSYDDQMFYDGYFSQDNLPEYQRFILEHSEDFKNFEFNEFFSIEDFIEFFNYFYPEAGLELVRAAIYYEANLSE